MLKMKMQVLPFFPWDWSKKPWGYARCQNLWHYPSDCLDLKDWFRFWHWWGPLWIPSSPSSSLLELSSVEPSPSSPSWLPRLDSRTGDGGQGFQLHASVAGGPMNVDDGVGKQLCWKWRGAVSPSKLGFGGWPLVKTHDPPKKPPLDLNHILKTLMLIAVLRVRVHGKPSFNFGQETIYRDFHQLVQSLEVEVK